MKLHEIINEGFRDGARRFMRNPKREFSKALTWDYVSPEEMWDKVQGYDDETLMSLLGSGASIPGNGSERQVQIKMIKRELRRRGYRDFEKYMD